MKVKHEEMVQSEPTSCDLWEEPAGPCFVYSPHHGFKVVATQVEARAEATDYLAWYRRRSQNGEQWDSAVAHVCWGFVEEVAATTSVEFVRDDTKMVCVRRHKALMAVEPERKQ